MTARGLHPALLRALACAAALALPGCKEQAPDGGAGRPVVALTLTGTRSNRDAIGARVEVNGYAQWIEAGSGFLSQHTKCLFFGLAGKDSADVKITWPSGATQQLSELQPGFRYGIIEGSSEVSRAALRTRVPIEDAILAGINRPDSGDTWLLEPIPTPDKHRGPGFLVLHAGRFPEPQDSLPVELVDLSRAPRETAAAYSLLRRYLFEYRTGLELPLTLLVDAESRVRKIYSSLPAPEILRGDLGKIDQSATLALPFPGRYYSPPHRNYFKLGAAFYNAGYPERAIPYLAEVVRAKPDNWKALLAIGRIQQESDKPAEALETYRKVLALRPDYAPAYVSAAEVLSAGKQPDEAHRMLLEALRLDPDSADAANQMGVLSASASDHDAARKWFQQAIASQPDHSGAINNLAVLYAKIGQTKDAIAAFQYGIKVAPGDEMLYLNLGRVYVMMGERDQAREVLGRLLVEKPGNALATRALAELENR